MAKNHHFLAMDETIKGKSLDKVLTEKLEALGVKVVPTWDENFKQRILAEKEAEARNEGLKQKLLDALKEIGVRVHPSIGMKKLVKRAKDHGINIKEE